MKWLPDCTRISYLCSKPYETPFSLERPKAVLAGLSRLKYGRVGLFAHSNVGVDTALLRCDLKDACRIGTSHADQLRDISTEHIGDDRLSKEHPGLDRSACLKWCRKFVQKVETTVLKTNNLVGCTFGKLPQTIGMNSLSIPVCIVDERDFTGNGAKFVSCAQARVG